MAVTNFSPLLGLALPTTGDLSGTWGTTVNDSITGLLDSAVAGTTTLSTDTNVTLSTTNGAANQARNAVLLCTGSRAALRTITAPAQSKAYVVINATTGGFGVKVVGSGPTTGVTINSGEKALIAWNGSDFVIVSSSIIDLTSEVTGTLPVANGGTGVTSSTGTGNVVLSNSPTLVTPALGTPSALVGTNITGTASGLTAGNVTTNANLTGAVTSVGNATSLGSFTSAQLAGALTDETGSGSAVFATSPTLVTPALGTPSSATLTNATGLPIDGGTTGTLPIARGGTAATTASAARTSLGATTLGANLFTVANPNAVTFPQFNADNTVSSLDAASFRTAIGAGSGGGSVTSVAATVPTFLSVSGSPITTSGTLAISLSGTALPVANGGTGATSLTANNVLLGNGTSALQVVAPGTSGNVLTSNGTTWTSAAPAVTLNGSETLTNKNIQSRVVVISDATSITINGDTTDIATQANTQSAGTLTINAPTGTPFNGQKIILRLLSTNVQTFSWNAAFAGSTDVALPTTSTGSSKYDYMGFVYNSTAATWQIIAKNFGF